MGLSRRTCTSAKSRCTDWPEHSDSTSSHRPRSATVPSARVRSRRSSTPTSSSTTSPSTKPASGSTTCARCAVLDVIANNADRKSGHCLIGRDGRRLRHRQRAVVPRPVQAAHRHLGLRRRADSDDALLTSVERLRRDGPPSSWRACSTAFEVDAMNTRAKACSTRGLFPDDDTDGHRWPWPLCDGWCDRWPRPVIAGTFCQAPRRRSRRFDVAEICRAPTATSCSPDSSCPRPIGWIGSVSAEGVHNLAPYSFFNAVSGDPPTVVFSAGYGDGVRKDTAANVKSTGEFTVNIVTDADRRGHERHGRQPPGRRRRVRSRRADATRRRRSSPRSGWPRRTAQLECRLVNDMHVGARGRRQLGVRR